MRRSISNMLYLSFLLQRHSYGYVEQEIDADTIQLHWKRGLDIVKEMNGQIKL